MPTSLTRFGVPPEAVDRRIGSRRQTPLTYIELGEDNGGTVLNISEGGLALQAVGSLIDHELPQMRFQFSEYGNWIETSGRVVWTSESKKMAGVEFVDLSDQTREQIREWISLDLRLNGYREQANPVEPMVNWPTVSGPGREVFPQEVKAGRSKESSFSSHSAVRNSEALGPQAKRTPQESSVSRESDSIPIKDDVPNEVSARQPQEGTEREQRKAGQESGGRAGFRNAYWLAASLALLVLLASVFELHRRQILHYFAFESEVPLESHMGLRLERAGTDWRFSWNPDAPIISKATKGHLSITDGTLRKILELDSSDLRGGAIIYTPSTNDVVLRLEVDDANLEGTVSESIRTAAGQSSSPASSQVPDVDLGDNRTGSGWSSRPSTASSSASRPDDPGARPAVSTSMSNRLLTVEVAKSLRTNPFKIPPNVKENNSLPVKSAEPDRPSSTPTLAVQPAPVAKADSVPTEEPVSAGALPARELVQPSIHREFAQLIVHKEPIYPPLARLSNLLGDVEVHFHIRADGTVHDVNVVNGNPVLAKAAVDAVRVWRYKPARLNGTPIETEDNAVISFRN